MTRSWIRREQFKAKLIAIEVSKMLFGDATATTASAPRRTGKHTAPARSVPKERTKVPARDFFRMLGMPAPHPDGWVAAGGSE